MPLDKIYYENNLSAKSADLNIIPRNDGGNLINKNNNFLYIEPITYKYINSTVNNVIKTNFEYYKFPSRIIVVDDVDADAISVNELDISDELTQSIQYRYKLNKQIVPILLNNKEASSRILNGTSNGRAKLTDNKASLTNNSIVDLSLQELNYNIVVNGIPQLTPNRFTVTQDILDANKDLRFTAQIALKFLSNTRENNYIAKLIQYNPDLPEPITIKEQISVTKLENVQDDVKQLYTQRENISDELYQNKNTLNNLKQQYVLSKLTIENVIEQQINQIINFVNSVIGLNQATTNNEILWQQILTDKLVSLPSIKRTELLNRYNELINNLANSRSDKTLISLQTQIDSYDKLIKTLQLDLIKINTTINSIIDPYETLRGQYGSLKASNQPYLINFDVIIDQVDLKLNNSYAIEMVVGQGSFDTEFIPLLLDEQSYWQIDEI